MTLRTQPAVNSQYSDGEVITLPTVDISVAVATPTGLITPIVTGADARGLTDISGTVRELAGRAREGKLQVHSLRSAHGTAAHTQQHVHSSTCTAARTRHSKHAAHAAHAAHATQQTHNPGRPTWLAGD